MNEEDEDEDAIIQKRRREREELMRVFKRYIQFNFAFVVIFKCTSYLKPLFATLQHKYAITQ